MSELPECKAEAARLMALLAAILRMLGPSLRQIVLRAGLDARTAGKYLRGEGEPRLDHLLGLARAAGLEYWELFEIAYPERSAPSDAARQLRRTLELLVPPWACSPPCDPALETSIRELHRDLRALMEKVAG